MEDGLQDIHSVLSESQDELYNMKVKFNEKMNEYCKKSDHVIKKPWTSAAVEEAIRDILDSNHPGKKTNRQYGLNRKYDTMEMGEKRVLIKKRKSEEDPVVVMLPVEEYFDTLVHYHLTTGHGGRDKLLLALKNEFYVPRSAVEMFVSLCSRCNSKKPKHQRDPVERPLAAEEFNLRSQVGLVDFQSTPCGEYKWLMNYQDQATKFCLLRPLRTKSAAEVALELLKVFLDFGAPRTLQSDVERGFTAKVIKELRAIWPDCNIVKGKPQGPQSQMNGKRCNQDVETTLRAWMNDNGSTDWILGCRFVQWQKNSSEHRVLGKSPYAALFKTEPKLGLSSTKLSPTICKKKIKYR